MKFYKQWAEMRIENLLPILHITFFIVNRLVIHKSPVTSEIIDDVVAVTQDLCVPMSLNQILVTHTTFCHVYL